MIDLRSDTVTRPTEAMLQSMIEASLEDDSRDGDTTVRKLESVAASRLGKEAAIFMPSGTMANLVAILTHTQRGGEILLEAGAHIVNSELGGITAVAGGFYKSIPGVRGAMDIERLTDAMRTPTRQSLGTALVCMETTHNKAGGTVLPLEHMKTVYSVAHARGVAVHTDGARIFNAAAALGVEARAIAEHTDSVCFCVSKGLSAPIGSLLCGTTSYIERARAFRRMVGGNMRQAGPLAAAALIALDTMVDRLKEDHKMAKRLASKLSALDSHLTDPKHVETNIVKVDLPNTGSSAAQWSVSLKEKGILVSASDIRALRFVTHRHISDTEIDAAALAFTSVWHQHLH